MSNIKSWSTTAASNNSAAPNGFPEGMAPSGVNDAAREVMASVRTWYEDVEWRDWGHTVTRTANTTFTIGSDVTAIYVANRPIRCTDSSTLYGYVVSSSYSAPNTTVTVSLDSGNLSASLTAVSLGVIPSNQPISIQAIRNGNSALLAAANAFTGDNTHAGIETFNKEIIIGSSSEVATANSLQLVGNTIYHLASGTSWIFKNAATGAGADRWKIHETGGIIGCNSSGTEASGGGKGYGHINCYGVWDNGARVWSTTTQSILSLAKAYCHWATAGTTILTSFNVTSVTNSGVGNETVNLTTAFSTANFAVGSSGGGQVSIINAAPASASTIQVDLINQQDSTTTIDDAQCSVIAFGAQ